VKIKVLLRLAESQFAFGVASLIGSRAPSKNAKPRSSGAGLQIVGQKGEPTMALLMLTVFLLLLRKKRTKLKIEIDL
jgi:hypothetical protein